MNKRSFLAFVSVFVLLLSSCRTDTSNDTGHKANSIRIAYATGYGSSVPQLVMLTGALDDLLPEGVSVEWININSSNDVRDALITNNLDVGIIAEPIAILALENDFPLVILGNSVFQSGVLFSNRPDIQSIDDIKTTDKMSIIALGNVYHLSLMLISKEKYGDANKFNDNFVIMQYADVLASLASSDELDCAVIAFPHLLRANEIEKISPILDLTPTIRDNNLGQLVLTQEEFYDNNPVLIDAIYEAFGSMIDFMNENTAEASRILADFYGDMDSADIEEQIKSSPPTLEISESAYDAVAELMYEVGMVPNPPKKFADLPNYDRIPKK